MRLALVIALLASSACVMQIPVHLDGQPLAAAPGPANKALDILFVVDNSGSMIEEQRELALTIYDPRCPIQDLNAVPQALLDPEPGLLEELSRVCGFSQILAAYDRDFRVGVITTDVNACDNLVPAAQGGADWGFRPQRGCLQEIPSTGERIISRSDSDVAGKFTEMMANIGTYGSPFERGLDAVDVFLHPDDAWVNPSCTGDRDRLLRDDAKLLIVFVTDEDDCSHVDDVAVFPSVPVTTCGELTDPSLFGEPSACYTQRRALAPVVGYTERLRALKGAGREGDVSVAVIGGALDRGGGGLDAGGCIELDSGIASDLCFASGGLSNFTEAYAPCGPEQVAAHGGLPCCTADGASRYFEVRDDAVPFTGGTICAPSYLETIIAATQATESDG